MLYALSRPRGAHASPASDYVLRVVVAKCERGRATSASMFGFPILHRVELGVRQYVQLDDVPIAPRCCAAPRRTVERDGMLLIVGAWLLEAADAGVAVSTPCGLIPEASTGGARILPRRRGRLLTGGPVELRHRVMAAMKA